MAFAAAIPALASLGGSIFGGISGKKAAKEQKKQMEKYMAMLQPIIAAQTQALQQSQAQGMDFLNFSKPYLQQGAGTIQDMLGFWKPLVSGDRAAIDQFFAPERRAINQGFQSQMQNLTTFAPRGGGRVSAMMGADRQRQGQLSDLVFGGRREAAGQTANLGQILAQLGLGGSQSGLSALSGAGQGANNMYGFTGNMMDMTNRSAANAAGNWNAIGQNLGGFLTEIFSGKKSGGGGSLPIMGNLSGNMGSSGWPGF